LRQEAHYGAIGDIIQTIAPETEADPVGLLVQLLVASGNSIGRTAHVRVEGDLHYCNLFSITVGKSGHGRKGTSWGRSRQVMEIGDPDWLRNCIASGMSSGEGLIYRVRDSKVAKNDKGEPDLTDPGILDNRLLAVETEFGQALRNLKRKAIPCRQSSAWPGTGAT
jgi:hypothetical protein